MATLAPRVVFVTRETELELLLARHATLEQARFYLKTRGQDLAELEARHLAFGAVIANARNAVPADWRQTIVRRADFDRFTFAAEDIIVAVGQDGLIPNVAKYLSGQPVVGINPAPDRYDGVLVRHHVQQLAPLLGHIVKRDVTIEARTMVEGVLDTGEKLCALNELFIGHRSHQSARYLITDGKLEEEQSSSGIIVATGTGATGWARSIMEATHLSIKIRPDEPALAWFVREPFPSVSTSTGMRSGKLAGKALQITSHMNDGGVVFADGIEQDFLMFDWGKSLSVRPSSIPMNFVV
ncbi:MAG: NAD(+)/NADH kinase [Sphingomonadales bacterium]|nr:NAD(+)/NADH kinase [Sphingomonadales bacterium]